MKQVGFVWMTATSVLTMLELEQEGGWLLGTWFLKVGHLVPFEKRIKVVKIERLTPMQLTAQTGLLHNFLSCFQPMGFAIGSALKPDLSGIWTFNVVNYFLA